MIAGASVRYRLYSGWGLTAIEITQVVLFCSTSLWLGFLALSAAVFTFEPLALPQSLHWPVTTVRPLGFIFLALAGIYLIPAVFAKKEWQFKDWRLSWPTLHLAVAQIAVAAADWLMAGSVLFCLMPADGSTGFVHFLEIFLIAQLAGLISQVPGGIGVFESVILLLVPGEAVAAKVVGALVVYRGIYYLLPLPFLELSHFLGSLAGMGLLLLARRLQRRLDGAYMLTLILLGFGIIASLLKGFDYEEATLLAFILVVLLPCRRYFFRRASLLSESFSPSWFAAISVVLISAIGLGLFAFRHVEYSHELWWHFSVEGEAPRFLRATVGALVLALGVGVTRLLRPAPWRPAESSTAMSEEVMTIVQKSPSAGANLALLGDKQFMFWENRQAFIMYGVSGRTWVSMGDPVGPVDQWPELLWQFRQSADRHGGRAVFYEVGHEHLHYYLDMGLTMLKLGEEARVPLSGFSLEGSRRKGLRYTHRKLAKLGVTFHIVFPPSVEENISTLKAVSDAWLKEKNTREKGFSLGCFNPDYLQHFPVGLILYQGKVVAFANLWQSGGREELTVDLMRHLPDAPSGVMDYLFIELMLWGADQGFSWFNLGMAPLSGMETREMAPLWHRLGSIVVRFGDHFYNFQGLRAYKDKFDPIWRPRYLASDGGLSLPRTLADVGALISGGLKGVLLK